MFDAIVLNDYVSAWGGNVFQVHEVRSRCETIFSFSALIGINGIVSVLCFTFQGDGNIRCYELSSEKPFISFLTEYRSLLPQKGLGQSQNTSSESQIVLALHIQIRNEKQLVDALTRLKTEENISCCLKSFRGDAKTWTGRQHVWSFPLLPTDCRQRPGGAAVHDRPTERGFHNPPGFSLKTWSSGAEMSVFFYDSSLEFSKRICTPRRRETRQPWRLRSGSWGSTGVRGPAAICPWFMTVASPSDHSLYFHLQVQWWCRWSQRFEWKTLTQKPLLRGGRWSSWAPSGSRRVRLLLECPSGHVRSSQSW